VIATLPNLQARLDHAWSRSVRRPGGWERDGGSLAAAKNTIAKRRLSPRPGRLLFVPGAGAAGQYETVMRNRPLRLADVVAYVSPRKAFWPTWIG
jgi:hypothetical protein